MDHPLVLDDWPPASIRTERLLLRAPEARDREAFLDLGSDPTVNHHLGGGREPSRPGGAALEGPFLELSYVLPIAAWGHGYAAEAGAAVGIWLGGALVLIQLVFAVLQWRNPKKWIAILFIVLIALGILQTAAAPLLAGMVPNAPVVPMWQVALSIAIMIVQIVLHIAGLRGINRLEAMQMDAAR